MENDDLSRTGGMRYI